MNRRVSFSPDTNGTPAPPAPPRRPAPLFFTDFDMGVTEKRPVVGIWTFRPPKNSGFPALRFLERIGAKVARALRFVSMNNKRSYSSSSSSSSSSSYSSSLERSRSYVDSHRAQAIEDCIEFLNSSSSSSYSSFQRSKSVSTFSY